jgi:hypothetical protein
MRHKWQPGTCVHSRSILVVSEYEPRLTATARSERLFANFLTLCLHSGIVRAVTRHGWWQIFPSTVDRHFEIARVVEYGMGIRLLYEVSGRL